MQPTKFCKNCKHFEHTHQTCQHEQAIRINPVSGSRIHMDAITMRIVGHTCSVEARLYEEKDK